jgi:sugar phosphate isomerase/epimerase
MRETRREFLKSAAAGFAAAASGVSLEARAKFGISLAQWSFHKALFAKQFDNLDFVVKARKDYDISAVEYVNQFFKDKARDAAYLGEMKKRADDHGVKSLLIMCDGEGALGDPDAARRRTAVENHYRWVEAAKFLGCHSIRVNAESRGSWDEQRDRAADGLRALAEFGDTHGINVIVENHGGLSSNGQWLAATIKQAAHPRCGTLPDFGNFRISANEEYDRYKGVAELMPFAKGVSAKSNDFDEKGNESRIDYGRMLKIVLDAGYTGFIGIEYEGDRLSEADGVRATQALLKRYL